MLFFEPLSAHPLAASRGCSGGCRTLSTVDEVVEVKLREQIVLIWQTYDVVGRQPKSVKGYQRVRHYAVSLKPHTPGADINADVEIRVRESTAAGLSKSTGAV